MLYYRMFYICWFCRLFVFDISLLTSDSCCQLPDEINTASFDTRCSLVDSVVYIMNVELSCSFSSPDSVCSLEGTGSQIVPLLACKSDVIPHLRSLGVSSGQQRSQDRSIIEVDLILNRAGRFVVTDDEKVSMINLPKT